MDVVWEPPGPGTWLLDSSHASTTPTPIIRDLFVRTIEPGLVEGFALIGAPLQTMQVRWVNGRFYRRLVPLVDRPGRSAPPPAVLWLVTRLHPAFRARSRVAAETLRTKRWRDELARWQREWRPGLVARNLELQAVDPAGLDEPGLARHLRTTHEHLVASATLHHRLHVSDLGPIGLLLVALHEWGVDAPSAFRALAGGSPATAAPGETVAELAAAVAAAGVEPTSLDDIRAAGPRPAALLERYLAHHGWRLVTGYDVTDRCLVEMPDVLLRTLRSDREGQSDGGDDHGAAVRASLPPSEQARFDELLADARALYGLRDENGPLTYEWPAGLLRRGLLEAGRRLSAAGRTVTDDDVFELEVSEVCDLLVGGAGPGADVIAARAAERAGWASLEAPARLGPDEASPPLWVLPKPLASMTAAVQAVVEVLESTSADALTGTGVGEDVYVGVARVVTSPEQALDLEPGDVVVALYTAPTYNAVLLLAGALVVEQGGLLCHAAVIARELGIPAVVGAKGAMTHIRDGDTVEVDPRAGRVRVVAAAAAPA